MTVTEDNRIEPHVAERAFGRFGRAIRISGAVDVGRARATLRHGELRVVLPRIARLGFETAEVSGARWRMFSVIARDTVIQVAQPLAVRESRAARLALRTLAPFGVLMPALALLFWWIVGRALGRRLRTRTCVSRLPSTRSTRVRR